MSENCQDTLRCDPSDLRQAMSIHTRKITDSCRDKDCIEDPLYSLAWFQTVSVWGSTPPLAQRTVTEPSRTLRDL